MSHKEILRRNHLYLKENLEVEKILDELYQRGVFSLADKERCKGKHGPAAQSEELLCILPRKGRQGYDIFLQILGKVQPYIKDHLEGRDSSDSHTASAPDQQLVDQLQRLQMENARLKAEAAQREKSHINLKSSHKELKASHEQVKQDNEMLRNQRLQKDQGAAGSDITRIRDSRGSRGISHDVVYHTLRFPGQTITLQCPKLQLDAAKANPAVCHVTTDGELVNSPPARKHKHSGGLQIYQGTCASTPFPLPPPPSTGTPAPHTSQYWETQSRVGVLRGGWWWLPVLEISVVEESQMDSGRYVCHHPRSWCVAVWSCDTHWGLCTRVCQQGEEGKCYSNTMSATPGTQATLHHGVVLDVGRGRLAFIDLNREVVLAKVDVEWSESLRPMFGVERPGPYTVNMKVISGADITMTDTKKSLIYDALN